jgi:hypothetical protein
MAATIPSTSLVPVQPVFSDAERLALAGFLAGYRGLPERRTPSATNSARSWSPPGSDRRPSRRAPGWPRRSAPTR